MLLEQRVDLGLFRGLFEELKVWALAFRRGDEGVWLPATGIDAREGPQCLTRRWKVDSDA